MYESLFRLRSERRYFSVSLADLHHTIANASHWPTLLQIAQQEFDRMKGRINMADNDEMDKIQEWQEHQHNPYYWVNKFSPLFPPKRTLGFWILCLLDVFLIVPAFLAFCWLYSSERTTRHLLLVVMFGMFAMLVILRAIRLRPDFNRRRSQAEIDEMRHIKKKEKKKNLPKRRKDYC